jgi:hypothetical protein
MIRFLYKQNGYILDILDMMDKQKSKKDMAEIRVFVKPELRQQFKSKCVLENKTMSDVIADFMANYVEDSKEETA